MFSAPNWKFYTICLILFSAFNLQAQELFPTNGVVDSRSGTYLLDNATIKIDGDAKSFVGDILIKEGKIINIAPEIKAKEAVVIDLTGKFIYPSFIDLYAQYGIEKLVGDGTFSEQFVSDKPGAYNWNEAIKAEFKAHEVFVPNSTEAEKFREAGFGAVLTHRQDGIARGSGALVALADKSAHEVIIKPLAASHLSLSKGTSSQNYPGSQMGAIALLKQTFHDGKWYSLSGKDLNITLQSWNDLQKLPAIIDASSLLSVFRVDKVGDEFGKQFIIKGNGDEYKRLDAIKATNAFMIVPVDFPVTFDTEDPWDVEFITLGQMKHWELAPYNLKMLEQAAIPFAITSQGLKNKSDFLKNVRLAVKNGLSESSALKALTSSPAKQLGVENEIGSISTGKWANLIVSDQPIFDEEAKILQNWILGIPYEINPINIASIDGDYLLKVGETIYKATLKKSDAQPELTLHLNDSSDVKANISLDRNQVTISFATPKEYANSGYTTLSGWRNNTDFSGKGRLANGAKVDWEASLVGNKGKLEKNAEEKEEPIPNETNSDSIGNIIYPFTAYGWEEKPKQETVLIKNATVWTNEKEGILENADVLIQNGKIAKVGKNLSAQNAAVVDGTGKHLTAGIIDEHSHIAINGGVNEWSQASTAEVSIGDVINSEDINIYRQLSGGVTAAQLLHGSANPIGGQSALIKLRWGSLPEEMKIENADGFIKFALGENVKNSGWSESIRFPQTRMGVEQVFVDHLTRAKEYLNNKDINKRIDIELEVLAQVLQSKRFITCHSYVQSELNMMMNVAEQFDFRINTFTHILEGYKVAEKMKEHGVGASTFSDWWAYKLEVMDAIPQNAALLNQLGVVTAINSDDAEMGRRLNQEAAKAVKYGGASEEDALKMVTLNPAILLHLEDRMGSIKPGKDADIVLWSHHPLSIYAKAEQTYVDGIKYYDAEKDAAYRNWMEQERARLVQKMLEEKKGGAKVEKPTPTEVKNYHCDDIEHWGQHE
jgi:imidazolonepropionase-like amidohydrolase